MNIIFTFGKAVQCFHSQDILRMTTKLCKHVVCKSKSFFMNLRLQMIYKIRREFIKKYIEEKGKIKIDQFRVFNIEKSTPLKFVVNVLSNSLKITMLYCFSRLGLRDFKIFFFKFHTHISLTID